MIQVIGLAEMFFDSNDVSLTAIKDYLNNNLVRYDILSHTSENNQNDQLNIKFILNMKEVSHCKTIADYNSYVFDEFNMRLPLAVTTAYVMSFKIIPVENETIKHIKEHMVKPVSDIFNN
ncbi:hypothetical protein [Oceanobacillus massiliensis]|uniref:hypothetical protein n=1 Tax=Oceanobacillus massiliensis TaxID=1465765 RepID=UPI00301AE54A